MGFRQLGTLRYWTFPSLDVPGLTHAIFTRQGGRSPAPWQALNVGGQLGDTPERVEANRRLSFVALERDPASSYDVWQVHGAQVVRANAPRPPDRPHLQADAILTNQPHVTLFMRFADCVPILLYDPVRQVVGLVHAGWKGTVLKVVQAAVDEMQVAYGSQPADLQAGIGPSIGPDHYQVGDEVISQVQQAFSTRAESVLSTYNSATHFDLWAANDLLLKQAGVEQVEMAGLCTACHLDDWYSHRAENGRTGRFGALIALNGS